MLWQFWSWLFSVFFRLPLAILCEALDSREWMTILKLIHYFPLVCQFDDMYLVNIFFFEKLVDREKISWNISWKNDFKKNLAPFYEMQVDKMHNEYFSSCLIWHFTNCFGCLRWIIISCKSTKEYSIFFFENQPQNICCKLFPKVKESSNLIIFHRIKQNLLDFELEIF